MSPKPLLVCSVICLATLIFGILPAAQTPNAIPESASRHSIENPPARSTLEALPVVTPYHPRPVLLGRGSDYRPPDFAQDRDIVEKKQAFYAYLIPKIDQANREITRERQWLLNFKNRIEHSRRLQSKKPQKPDSTAGATHEASQRVDASFDTEELTALARLGKRYNLAVDTRNFDGLDAQIQQLLLRVDVVPASLVLAQAAKESGWGSSRFAREGNNFFGIWCFYPGCGMTPERRDAGRRHEVAMFDTVEESVRYYLRTINSHAAYVQLRQIRAAARNNNQPFGGEQLAPGLLCYSERGLMYVNEIQSMIRTNRLQRFTRQYSV